MTWLFQFGLAPAPASPRLSQGAFCFSHILTSLEEQVVLANKHVTIGPLKNLKTAYQQKYIRNKKGEFCEGDKVLLP